MSTKNIVGAGPGEEATTLRSSGAGGVRKTPPAEFVYDEGQIMIELLRGRAAEEEKRRFIAGLRHLNAVHSPDEF